MKLFPSGLILLAASACINQPVLSQQIDTSSQPGTYTGSINITGIQQGPYNIRVQVQPLRQVVPVQQKPKPSTNSNDQAITQSKPDSPPVNLGTFFPSLFGGDESHHHGPNGSDQPFVTVQAPLVVKPPSIDNPYLPGLPPRYDDPNYQCYNYVYEQITGIPANGVLGPDDVTSLLKSFSRETYKPKSKLPDNFPPGTILLFAGHVGIVGSDGHTIFNFTKKSKENNLPATLHQTPTANALWNHTDPDPPKPKPVKLPNEGFLDRFIGPSDDPVNRTQGNQPYVNSPVQVFTPPQR